MWWGFEDLGAKDANRRVIKEACLFALWISTATKSDACRSRCLNHYSCCNRCGVHDTTHYHKMDMAMPKLCLSCKQWRGQRHANGELHGESNFVKTSRWFLHARQVMFVLTNYNVTSHWPPRCSKQIAIVAQKAAFETYKLKKYIINKVDSVNATLLLQKTWLL